MCGIAGTINFNNVDTQDIQNSLFHRGPDENGVYSYKNINLIHTRLSIQDINHGQQPYSYNGCTMVFNGEIYNHLHLREIYLQDFSFKSSSDTETLLYMYIKYKNDMFDKLDGMYAFCILDESSNKLVLARDRAGKKPLYVYKDTNSLMFASELNSFKTTVKSLEVDDEKISAYLRNGFFFKDTTPYKNIIEVDAGSVYEVDLKTLNIKQEKYFEILDIYKQYKLSNYKEAKDTLDTILHQSVKSRLLSSDLEVGAFLSGGIDSSLVVAIASEYTQNLKTFTVKFDGAFDESHLARLTANKYNTQHHELSISMDLKNDIESILSNYGEPFMDSSAIPSFYVSKEAKKYVSVVLNGDGADELFGGYRRYVPSANNILNLASYFSPLLSVLPKSHDKKSSYNKIYRLLSMSSKNGLDFYNSATNDIFEDVYKFDNNSTFKEINKFIKSIESQNISQLDKMLYMDFSMILKSDLLKKMDIASMSNSLEVRSPFLSKEMLEFVPRLADNFKIKNATTKYILRDLAKRYIPSELINQPKRGFEVPLKKWVENDLKDNIFDALSYSSYSQNFVKKEFIDKLLKNKVNTSAEKRAKMLWTMYSLEIWKKSLL